MTVVFISVATIWRQVSSIDRVLVRLTKYQKRIPGQPPLPRRSSVGHDIESSRSTPASIATSDTIVLSSETSTSDKRYASFVEDDLMFQLEMMQEANY